MPQKKQEKGTIAVIGGGLGGSLTAIMLAKQGYNVKLIEAQDSILNGASRIAARLHLGGEYPKDEHTRMDCLESAIIWKLLMPPSIYTAVNKMKFLLTKTTHALGLGSPPETENALTTSQYLDAYEGVRTKYAVTLGVLKKTFSDIEQKLFGPADKGVFFRTLSPDEYAGYTNIESGFQSQEHGLDPVRYLAMIQYEIERLSAKETEGEFLLTDRWKCDPDKRHSWEGRIEVLTNHKVLPAVDKDGKKIRKGGIKGKLDNFTIYCEHNGAPTTVKADQVVNAAWSGGPAIVPELNRSGDPERQVQVHRRAMMVVDLPKGFKADPAFVMLGASGGMVSPFNDKCALVYLPLAETAYIKSQKLRAKNPNLPEGWNDTPDLKQRTQDYFEKALVRFPFLQGASNPRLLIDDTLTFGPPDKKQDSMHALSKRRQEKVEEVLANPTRGGGDGLTTRQEQKRYAKMLAEQKMDEPLYEVKKGLFALYPTKATYGVNAALQTALMVDERSRLPDKEELVPKNILTMTSNELEKFSLEKMRMPKLQQFWQRFFKEHPDLRANMMSGKMPEAVQHIYEQEEAAKRFGQPAGQYWQNAVAKRQPPQLGY